MKNPKVFISYSWTNKDHEAWVLQLATELRDSGVDAILDKWDLKEGHDAKAFMESMVTDHQIEKVILVCDRAYAEKTDERKGGVGTEAQIISGEIYAKQAQDKFVAVIAARDDEGQPYLPVYYKSRVYIDLSDVTTYAENFDLLLRWVFDKPLNVRPELGKVPAFLEGTAGATGLATSSRFRRAIDIIKHGRPHAVAALVEYLQVFAKEVEKIRLPEGAEPYDDAVVESIEAFLPYRNEAIELFATVSLYLDTHDSRWALHRFFESLIPYLNRPAGVTSWHEDSFDNFRFLVHELFLYALAILIRDERFDAAAFLMSSEYYSPDRSEYGKEQMASFAILREYMRSLERRNQRLNMNRLSLRADLLKQRCQGVAVNFRHLMQADFVLFMRDRLTRRDGFDEWWPETLLYADRVSVACEVFARSRSAAYFGRAKVLLGVDSKDDLKTLLAAFAADRQRVPRWQFESFSPANLLGYDELATRP